MRQGIITVLLILAPAFLLAQTVPQAPVITSAYDLVAPTGVVHVENIANGDRQEIHCVISANDGTADMRFDGRSIRFGDGYSVVYTVLANTTSAFVTRVVASGPNGPTATAILALNPKTQETVFAGWEDFAAMLRRSHHAQIAAKVLPLAAQPAAGSISGNASSSVTHVGRGAGLRPKTTDCASSGFQLMVSAAVAASTCPGGVMPGCLGGAGGMLISGYNLYTGGCIQPIDNTVGWG